MSKAEKKILLKVDNVGVLKNDKWLVKGVSLEVKQGEIVTLIGPNGSGKSTTAKIALGIYKNIEGSVEKYTNRPTGQISTSIADITDVGDSRNLALQEILLLQKHNLFPQHLVYQRFGSYLLLWLHLLMRLISHLQICLWIQSVNQILFLQH